MSIQDNINEVEQKEDVKEWASSFTSDGVEYATSIFWESLQNINAPYLDAKDAAENVLPGADLFCVKHGKSPQLGLAISEQGFKKGQKVAAVTAATAMSDSTSLLAVFKVNKGYWYICVRNDVILSDGDILFINEADAHEQFLSMLSVPDWSKKIAPASWGIDETEEVEIDKVLSQGLSSKLEKINKLRGMDLAIVIVLSVAIGAWAIMYVGNTLFAPKVQEKKVVTRRAVKKPVVKAPEVILAPWESMPETNWFIDTCREATQSLVSISTPGWRNNGVSCTPSGAVTSWSMQFGRLSWIELSLANSNMSFTNKAIEKNGTGVTVSQTFQSIKNVSSIPKDSEKELINKISDLFQSLNLKISTTPGKVKAGDKIYSFISFKMNSKYDPEIWKTLFLQFSGLKLNNIRYNNGVWNYEGTIYVK